MINIAKTTKFREKLFRTKIVVQVAESKNQLLRLPNKICYFQRLPVDGAALLSQKYFKCVVILVVIFLSKLLL